MRACMKCVVIVCSHARMHESVHAFVRRLDQAVRTNHVLEGNFDLSSAICHSEQGFSKPYVPVRITFALLYIRIAIVDRHNYIGHNYMGHNYIGHNFVKRSQEWDCQPVATGAQSALTIAG